MSKFKRVYHPISRWEEIKHNMWGDVKDKKKYLSAAIEFTGNHELYGEHMMRVVREWRVSCENALTDYRLNRRAWIGHAACALALKCPEDITRDAWSKLSDEQRLLANQEADRAIAHWEHTYAQGAGVREDLGAPMLL
jgi:hypothetical protein